MLIKKILKVSAFLCVSLLIICSVCSFPAMAEELQVNETEAESVTTENELKVENITEEPLSVGESSVSSGIVEIENYYESESESETSVADLTEEETTTSEIVNDPQEVEGEGETSEPAAEEVFNWKTKVSTSYTGLAQEASGTWYYLVKGKPDLTYSNLVYYYGSWFYVHNGIIDWSYTTLSQVNGSGVWYYVKNGKIDWNFTGLYQYYDTWYYIEKGRLNWGYNNLVYWSGNWFYVKGGRIDWNYSNLVRYGGKWFYVHNGKIDWNYSTLAQVNGSGVWYYVKNGQIDWNYTGLSQYYTTWYYIKKGRLDWGYTGLAYYGGSWFYVKGGRLDWSYTGLAYYGGDWFYMEKGKLNWGYTGKATIPGYNKQFDVVKGKVSGGLVAPTAALAKKADNVLNSVGWNLRAAFNWCARMQYLSYIENGSPGVAHFANYGFDHYRGNCYVYAGMFVCLARELGYEAYQISGHVRLAGGGLHPHSWTEVKIGNTWYVFDPNFSNERYGQNDGYQIYYGKKGTWQYAEWYRMQN